MRLKEKRLASGLKAKALGQAVGLDESMISRFENYRCLPTPPDMDKLCRALACAVSDLYDPAEIRFARPKKGDSPAASYRMTVDLPAGARAEIRDALTLLGYKSVTAWIEECCGKLLQKAGRKKQKDSAEAEPKGERGAGGKAPRVNSIRHAGAPVTPKGEKHGAKKDV